MSDHLKPRDVGRLIVRSQTCFIRCLLTRQFPLERQFSHSSHVYSLIGSVRNYPESRKQLSDIEEENVEIVDHSSNAINEIANDNHGHFKRDRIIGNNSNYHNNNNNNDKNENRGAKSLDEKKLNEIVDQLLIDEGLRATETYDSEVFLSSPEKYGAGEVITGLSPWHPLWLNLIIATHLGVEGVDIHLPPLHPPPLQILGLILGLGAG